jgi:tungstate transport system substrate-binding protein
VTRRGTLAAWVAVVALVGCHRDPRPQLVLVTTTSVANAGLLDALLPEYERQQGVRFGVHPVGSGRALQMLASGDADVAISHAPETEAATLRTHPDWWYRKIMYNDFLLVGPPDDPAHVKRAASLDDALKRIALSAVGFVSRADESGTHERERALWKALGVTPARTLTTGQNMAITLRITAERGAYTLTDHATWTQFATTLSLTPVSEGDPRLLNTYAVIVAAGDQQREAMAFGQCLAQGAGRDVIAQARGFRLWPKEQPGTDPAALPLALARGL